MITQEELERRLQESGVRILVGELRDVPRTLQDWDLIEPDGSGYRFRVELLRRWIAERKPLFRVQEEIDYIQPVAENLFQAAYAFYQGGRLKEALPLLQQVVRMNPNHQRGTLLLAQILLTQDQLDEALQLLENLFQYSPAAARPRLIQVLLLQAQANAAEEKQLELYDRVLVLEQGQPEALAGQRRIWEKRGDVARTTNDIETAVKAYQEAGVPSSKILEVIDKYITDLERSKNFVPALGLARQLWREQVDLQTRLASAEAAQTRAEDVAKQERKRGDEVASMLREQLRNERRARQEAEQKAQETVQLNSKLKMELMSEKSIGEKEGMRNQSPDSNTLPVQSTVRQLAPWNPLDHLRVLWWLFVTPGSLEAYRSEGQIESIGRWLAAALICLPILIPCLALGVGALQPVGNAPSAPIYLLLSGVLILAGGLTGWLNGREMDSASDLAFILAFVATFIAAVGVATGVALTVVFVVAYILVLGIAVGVSSGVTGVAAAWATFGIAFSASFGVALVVAVDVTLNGAFLLAVSVALVLAFIVSGIIAYLSESSEPAEVLAQTFAVTFVLVFIVAGAITGGMAGGFVSSLLGLVAVILALLSIGIVSLSVVVVVESVLKNKTTAHPTMIVIGITGTLALLTLVWFGFLGGWQIFTR